MGKQAKKRHRDAVTLAAQAHPATQQATPADDKPKHTHAPSAASDTVTGEAIDPARYRFFKRDSDVDESRPVAARQPIPMTLNTSRVTAVGADWSPAFARYMAPVLPRIVAEERRMWVCWWDVEYVVQRLVHYLGKETVSATILVLRDEWSVSRVARQSKRSDAWVCRQITITLAWAETYFTHKPNRRGPRSN